MRHPISAIPATAQIDGEIDEAMRTIVALRKKMLKAKRQERRTTLEQLIAVEEMEIERAKLRRQYVALNWRKNRDEKNELLERTREIGK